MKCKVCGEDNRMIKDICGICAYLLKQCNQCKGFFLDPKIIKEGYLCNHCYDHALTCKICDYKHEDSKMSSLWNGNYCHDCFNSEDNIFQICSECGNVFHAISGLMKDPICPKCGETA